MGREQERRKKRLEKNPIEECNRIQQKYYPELLTKFNQALDPRHLSYVDYSIGVMLGTLYYKNIAGISSMREMTSAFNEDTVVENISRYLHVESKDFLPHGVTLNEFLERLDPAVMEEIRKDMVKQLIRRKTFDDAKVQGKWLIIVDGTELDECNIKKNDRYLKREYNKGKENAKVKYHNSVLEAKIWFGNDLICSIETDRKSGRIL